MCTRPNYIDVSVLDNGIKDIEIYKEWGHYLAKKVNEKGRPKELTTSQLRKFFGAIKQIQVDFDNKKREIILLDAKLAYAVGRDTNKPKSKITDFYNLLSPLIKGIKEDPMRFKNFVNIVEAIVAYHKEKESEN